MRSGEARGRRVGHAIGLAGLLGSFALTGYVIDLLQGNAALPRMLVWFAGALVVHDLVAFPLYAAIDRLGVTTFRPARVNYVRLPTAASALLLVVYLPGIIRQGGNTYLAATGQTQQPFLGRWILLSVLAFAISGVVYLARRVTGRRKAAKT